MHRNISEVVRTGFLDAFGAAPEGVWSAPGRVSLMGDHTDIEDGLSYGFAYDARSAVAVSRRSDDLVRIRTDLTSDVVETRLSEITPPTEYSWQDYPLGLLWVIRGWLPQTLLDDDRERPEMTGLDLFLSTDVPIGAGLASSASMCAAMSTALNELWDLRQGPMKLARFGHTVENEFLNASSGMSDHVTVLLAEEGRDVFYDARGNDGAAIDVAKLSEFGLAGMVVESGETHRNWAGKVNDRHEACRRVADALDVQRLREASLDDLEAARERLDPTDYRRAHFVITEIRRVLDFTRLLRTEGPNAALPLFAESQRSLRDDFEVSTQRLDLIAEVATSLGAEAARMTGSGFGGAMFIVLPEAKFDTVRDTLVEAFAEYGWDGLRVYQAVKSGGARRDA